MDVNVLNFISICLFLNFDMVNFMTIQENMKVFLTNMLLIFQDFLR